MDTGLKRSAVLLVARFLLLAPLCLVLWLLILPYYVEILANVTALLLSWTGYGTVEAGVKAAGFLNTETSLSFTFPNRSLTMPGVGHLLANMAPFLALVLATPRMKATRRMLVIGAGTIAIFLSHLATLIMRLPGPGDFQTGRTPFTTAVGFFSITLPFLLWIVMAYWGQLKAFLGEDRTQKEPDEASSNP